MNQLNIKTSLAPIIDLNSKILILGSMPGDISLEKKMYYANPHNHFWKIIFEIFNQEFIPDYNKRIAFMLSKKIALWDVLEVCEREGSLDSNIRNVKINDISGLLEKYPNIDTIFLNGGEADRRLTQKYRKGLKSNLIFEKLPSTSPVPGKNVLQYSEKIKVWSKIVDRLLQDQIR